MWGGTERNRHEMSKGQPREKRLILGILEEEGGKRRRGSVVKSNDGDIPPRLGVHRDYIIMTQAKKRTEK